MNNCLKIFGKVHSNKEHPTSNIHFIVKIIIIRLKVLVKVLPQKKLSLPLLASDKNMNLLVKFLCVSTSTWGGTEGSLYQWTASPSVYLAVAGSLKIYEQIYCNLLIKNYIFSLTGMVNFVKCPLPSSKSISLMSEWADFLIVGPKLSRTHFCYNTKDW